MSVVKSIIKLHKMAPHPEGGYYAEVFKSKDVSQIYFLLEGHQHSHWHRITKNEILHFYSGDTLSVFISKDGKSSVTKILGHNIEKDENNHLIIKAGSWFSMKSNGKYSLIGCTVAPAFDYKDFELAPPKWSPG